MTSTITLPMLYVIRLMDSRGRWVVWTEATRDDADVCLDACGEDDVRRQLWYGGHLLKDEALIDDDDDEEGVWADYEDHIVVGLNSEGFWEALGKDRHLETKDEAMEVYKTTDRIKFPIIEIRHRKKSVLKSIFPSPTLLPLFDAWRKEQERSNPQYTMDDELAFLKENAKNQGEISSVFDHQHVWEYEYSPLDGTYHEVEVE